MIVEVQEDHNPRNSAHTDLILSNRLSSALSEHPTRRTKMLRQQLATAKMLQLLHWLNPKVKFSRACRALHREGSRMKLAMRSPPSPAITGALLTPAFRLSEDEERLLMNV